MTDANVFGLFSHDAITITYYCSMCKQNGYLLMEFGGKGKFYRKGRYATHHFCIKRMYDCNLRMDRIKECYDQQRGASTDYDAVTYNCKTFAKELYERIDRLH